MVGASGPQRTVWIVDDIALDVERAQRALSADYAVTGFTEAALCLERLSAGAAPDVLVLDWVMPNLSGIEVCQFLRAQGGSSEKLGILLLTGAREVDQVVTGLASGADDYLAKPYSDAELRARVGALIRTRELHERSERAEAHIRALLRDTPDALLAFDRQGNIVFANTEAAAVFGVPATDLNGRTGVELLPDLARFWTKESEGRVTLPDVTVNDRVYAPTLRLGSFAMAAHATVALRDVTETRREETRRMDFYSMVAHDMRSPLSAMLMRGQLMEQGRYGPLTPVMVAELRKNQATMQSLLKLINDFTDFARLEGAGLKLERVATDMAELTRRCMDELRPLAEARKLRFVFDPPAEASFVVGDAGRLTQVLVNLISNAIKFTLPGGRVGVQMAWRNSWLEVRVEDTGPGIPATALPTLFDRFTRVETPGLTTAGTGLGLMIAKQIIEAHGGKIGVETQEGQGSVFWFVLSGVEPKAPAATLPLTAGA
jgi:signal transduction histidine kinase